MAVTEATICQTGRIKEKWCMNPDLTGSKGGNEGGHRKGGGGGSTARALLPLGFLKELAKKICQASTTCGPLRTVVNWPTGLLGYPRVKRVCGVSVDKPNSRPGQQGGGCCQTSLVTASQTQ